MTKCRDYGHLDLLIWQNRGRISLLAELRLQRGISPDYSPQLWFILCY